MQYREYVIYPKTQTIKSVINAVRNPSKGIHAENKGDHVRVVINGEASMHWDSCEISEAGTGLKNESAILIGFAP